MERPSTSKALTGQLTAIMENEVPVSLNRYDTIISLPSSCNPTYDNMHTLLLAARKRCSVFCGNLLLLYPSKLALAFATAFLCRCFSFHLPPPSTSHSPQGPAPATTAKKSPNHKKFTPPFSSTFDSSPLVILLSHTASAIR